MKQSIAFFAHYDPHGLIADYVVKYIAALFDAGMDRVYFSSDSDLKQGEPAKLPARTTVANDRRHGEYDFGSWKRCLLACEKEHGNVALQKNRQLILCNDSCYGPLFPLRPMFDAMDRRDCDFWGITRAEYFGGFYPSYLLVFKASVLCETCLPEFLKSVGKFTDKQQYCRQYEVGICRSLESKGYRGDYFLSGRPHLDHASAEAFTPAVFEEGMPFIRVLAARNNPAGISRLGRKIADICRGYGYPLELIRNHLARTAPGYEKCWSYKPRDIDRSLMGLIRICQKPNPARSKVLLRITLLGITVLYLVYPMSYVKTATVNCLE